MAINGETVLFSPETLMLEHNNININKKKEEIILERKKRKKLNRVLFDLISKYKKNNILCQD